MKTHQITVNGDSFRARHGELLLDAALAQGIDMAYDCRAGHCGTCCVRLVAGDVKGGAGAEPGIVHACQCRIIGDAVLEQRQACGIRSVDGVLNVLRPLSRDVWEAGIRIDSALPYHAGQYAKVAFSGYPSRPFSITHPLRGSPSSLSLWFHIRRMKDGRVTEALGNAIKPGHRVQLEGPFGTAHFHADLPGRLIMVATSTGFAPIWSVAVAALRENPRRPIVVIAGGRTLDSLYMGPALARLARFPLVQVVRTLSAAGPLPAAVKPGRPTDYLPRLTPTDVIYVCGAPALVDSVRAIADRAGVACYADAFLPNARPDGSAVPAAGVVTRAVKWFAAPGADRQKLLAFERPRDRRDQPNAAA